MTSHRRQRKGANFVGFLARHGNKLVGAIVSLTLILGITASSGSPRSAPKVHAINVRTNMWTRLSQERAARGLLPLTWNGRLSERSAGWSKRMAQSGHLFHSDLKLPPRLGLYDYLGETIATGSRGVDSGTLFRAFMLSPEHRDILLSPGFTSAGIGVFCAPNHSMWVTILFGRRVREGPPPFYLGGTPEQPVVRTDVSRFRC